jgi:hypothetical protein
MEESISLIHRIMEKITGTRLTEELLGIGFVQLMIKKEELKRHRPSTGPSESR